MGEGRPGFSCVYLNLIFMVININTHGREFVRGGRGMAITPFQLH